MKKSNRTETVPMSATNQVVTLADYAPHKRNYNRHPATQVERIAKSLQKFGQVRSVVVWRNFFLAGHGVREAAMSLGWETLRADVLPDEYPETLALAYVAADNELGRLGDPDQAQLAQILSEAKAYDEELLAAIGYDDAEFDKLLAEVGGLTNEPGKDTEPQIDRAEELRKEWGVELGQMWALGEHRLICGDCTDKATVERVMGGDKAEIVFTSPPYAHQRDYEQKIDDWGILMQGAFGSIPVTNDAQVLVNLGLTHSDGEWHPYWETWIEWMRLQGWRRFGWYVWDQGFGLPGDWNGRLAPSHEFVFHFNKSSIRPEKTVAKNPENVRARKKGQSTFRESDGTLKAFTSPESSAQPNKIPDSVIRVNRQIGRIGDGLDHPAPFSVAFAEFILREWPGLAYEPFSGSGTTLIACQNLSRKCRAIEISSGYVAVALQRFLDHTGIQPELLPNG